MRKKESPWSEKEYKPAAPKAKNECVILLHGLARTHRSMAKMARHLAGSGYRVLNGGYPSRTHPVEHLSRVIIPGLLATCRKIPPLRIHFVTHSMGGLLIRHFLSENPLPELGRIVMLSPPNQGSQVVDHLKSNLLFMRLNGPAGQQLGTDPASLPRQLGKANFELGIITGDRSVNPLLSLFIPGPNDGKVGVANARLEGMRDFLVVHASHPFIMKNNRVIRQTLHFLKNGKFNAD